MLKDDRVYLNDIVDSIQKIQDYIGTTTFDHFSKDHKTLDAVVRNLEIVGEAVRHLSDAFKISVPEVEWGKIVALRNILIHEYFGVNEEIVWDVVKNKLPFLKIMCQKKI